ncbi:MAG: helix-turn-helix transcriptional regulator [Bacteroidales bacterium]|nr:helix-turn-helix transcriptional regulator [Bacteroidales bacterium]
MQTNKQNIGTLLKELRTKNGITKYYAEKNGLQQATLNSIENGDKAYTIDSLLKYLDVCKIQIEEFSLKKIVIYLENTKESFTFTASNPQD